MCPSYGAFWCIFLLNFFLIPHRVSSVFPYFSPKICAPFLFFPFLYSFSWLWVEYLLRGSLRGMCPLRSEENFEMCPSYGAFWCIFFSKFCPYSSDLLNLFKYYWSDFSIAIFFLKSCTPFPSPFLYRFS